MGSNPTTASSLPNDSFVFQGHGNSVAVRDETSGIIRYRAISRSRSVVKVEACGSSKFAYALHLQSHGIAILITVRKQLDAHRRWVEIIEINLRLE
jgi:hypothetical protein